jgi:hypothetical protein
MASAGVRWGDGDWGKRVAAAGRWFSWEWVQHAIEKEISFSLLNFQSTQKAKENREKYLDASEKYENFSGGRLEHLEELLY